MTRLTQKTTMSNSNINSGTEINMNCTELSEKQDFYTNVYETPNALATPNKASQLNSYNNTGFSNPQFTISGVINLKDDHSTGSSAVFDREYKEEFAGYSWDTFILRDNLFVTSSNTQGTIRVVIKNFTCSRNNDSVNGHFMDYRMTVQEVSA